MSRSALVSGSVRGATSVAIKTLPREARVRRRADYLRVQKQSARVAAPHFVFLITASPSSRPGVPPLARPRLGIIASKQVGNAVVRARAKRLVRAAFREVWPRFPAGVDVIVLVRGDTTALRLTDVLGEWRSAEAQVVRKARATLAPRPAALSPGPALAVRAFLLASIAAYQRFVSPFLGANCRFYPSCSAYAAACIEAHGSARGTLLSVIRVCKCHPFHPGGFDYPPRSVAAATPTAVTPPEPLDASDAGDPPEGRPPFSSRVFRESSS